MKTCLSALALLACLLTSTASAMELGRLFHTPAERRELDRPATSETSASKGTLQTLRGRLRRDGDVITWIDEFVHEPQTRIPTRARVGDRIDPGAGVVHELLGEGRLVIHRHAPR